MRGIMTFPRDGICAQQKILIVGVWQCSTNIEQLQQLIEKCHVITSCQGTYAYWYHDQHENNNVQEV